MASIDDVYRLVKYRITKAGFNGNLSPNDFNLLWQGASRRWFNKQYQRYQLTQEIGDSLLPFKTDPIPITVDVNGKWTKPDPDVILHIDSIRVPYGEIESEVVRFSDDRIANKLSSEYDAPDAQFPVYVDYKLYLQFYPKNIVAAIIVYLEKLEDSLWAYTLVNGRPVYDEENSIQPKWTDNDLDEICYLVGSDLGLNLRDNTVLQVMENKIKTDL